MKREECLFPTEIRDLAIKDFYSKEVKESLIGHIKECSICQERLHEHKLNLVRNNKVECMDEKEREQYIKYIADMASLDEYASTLY